MFVINLYVNQIDLCWLHAELKVQCGVDSKNLTCWTSLKCKGSSCFISFTREDSSRELSSLLKWTIKVQCLCSPWWMGLLPKESCTQIREGFSHLSNGICCSSLGAKNSMELPVASTKWCRRHDVTDSLRLYIHRRLLQRQKLEKGSYYACVSRASDAYIFLEGLSMNTVNAACILNRCRAVAARPQTHASHLRPNCVRTSTQPILII